MISQVMLEEVVALIRRKLADPTLYIGFAEYIFRHADVGPDEWSNPEFVEDLMPESEEVPSLLIEEGGPEPTGAYLTEEVLVVVDQGDKYAVPLEDIVSVGILENEMTIIFRLVNGSFTIIWMTQADIDRYESLRED